MTKSKTVKKTTPESQVHAKMNRISLRRSGLGKVESPDEKIEIKEMQEFKIAVVGFSKSGKSAICQQYCMNQFITEHDETIEDTYNKKSQVTLKHDLLITPGGGKQIICTLNISDTCGKIATLNDISESVIGQCNGILLVMAVSSKESYDSLLTFYDDVQRMQPGVAVVVCANKTDECHDISDTALNMIATACAAPLVKTSAKNRSGIDEAFEELINEILNKQHVSFAGLEHLQHLDGGTDTPKKKRDTLSARLSRVFKK